MAATYISTSLSADRKKVIVWERDGDNRYHVEYDAVYDFFLQSLDGKYRSVTGEKLSRISFDNPYEFYETRKRYIEEDIKLYESDISPELKVLSDKYYGKEISSDLHITFYDIEVDYDPQKGHADTSNPYAPISSVALYHMHTDRSIVLAVPPKKGKWKNATVDDLPPELKEKSEIVICKNEKELLIKFFEEINDSDVVSGWNCLPVGSSVWGSNEIVRLQDVKCDSSLYDSRIKNVSPVSKKVPLVFKLANGLEITSSSDHRFPVVTCKPEAYTKFSGDIRSRHESGIMTAREILESSDSVFMKVVTRENNNSPCEQLSLHDCYLAGLLYTDGSLKDKNNLYGYTFYQSDRDFIEEIAESKFISGNRDNGYSTYIKPKSREFHELIYNPENIKSINLTALSRLSKEQFYHFLSGMLDGDGYIQSGVPTLCCYNPKDIKAISELLLWNGIFFTTTSTTIRLIDFDLSSLFLKKHSRWFDTNGLKIRDPQNNNIRNNSQQAKKTRFKKINSGEYLVRVKSVDVLEETVEMMDIETDTHYFISGGIRVHNCELFDNPYVYLRTYKVLGENATNLMNFENAEKDVRVTEVESYGKMEIAVRPVGRIWIDYMQMVKKFDANERSSYSLEAVALEELDDMEKLNFNKSLYRLYHEDFDKFIEYNIQDTAILKGLESGFKYMDLALQFSHMVTNHMQSVLGTVSTSDTAILNFCKFETPQRLCLPDANKDIEDQGKKFAGAFVLDPQIGLHEMIGSVDIKSLYPSAMRAVNISPDTIIGQFFENEHAYESIVNKTNDELTILYENEMDETMTGKEWFNYIREQNWLISAHGTVFDQRSEGIIPAILSSWFNSRIEMQKLKDEYKDKLNTVEEGSNEHKEYKKKAAYYDNIQYLKKIQLNSMYGVFGNKFFRFFDIRLAESTTKTGKAILMHMAKKVAEIMDGEYTYPSESVLYGDTDSIYFSTQTETTENAKIVADTLNKIINKSYPKFLKDHFNCAEGREKFVVAEREVISDRGIFVKKKHYLLHLVDKDGREVDEMKVMGLQIKKTSIPKFIRVKITDFFERFLKGEDWKQIKKDIVKFKQELKEMDIIDLGKPTGVNKVEKYTEDFNNGETVSVGHVKASILYNTCLNKYGDGESMNIRSGMKIRVYNFYSQKKFGKFTCIAIPTDLDLLPDWFEYFKPYIDADKQISILVDRPIKNILDAIGEAVPTAKNVMADDIFAFGV